MNKLSGGQQRRLDVAVALAGDPELLFLDEPTTGFDPNARRNAWEIVKNLTEIGKTIFLTTHFMDEAQYLATRVGRDRERPDRRGGHARDARWPRPHADTSPMQGARGTAFPTGLSEATSSLPDGSFEIRTDNPTKVVHDLTAWALERGFVFDVLEVTQPSLEDVYIELTGGEAGTG